MGLRRKATRQGWWERVRLSVPLLTIFVMTVAVAVYVPSLLHASFRADDFGWIARVATPQGVMWNQVLSYFYSQVPASGSTFYRPLYHVYLALIYEVWGVNALGYVLNNILLRALSAVLVALIALELSSRRWVGLLAGLLFALYPTHPFSMNYVNDLPNVLATVLYLLALFAYLKWRDGKGYGYLLLSVGAFALALLSKEIAFSLPVVVLIYELYRRTPWRRLILPMGAFGIVSVVYFTLRYVALGQFLGGYDNMLEEGSTLRDPTLIIPTLARFLGLMLAPYNPNLLDRAYSPTYLVTLLVSIFFIFALASQAKLRTITLFLAAFLATFLPILPLFMGFLRGPGYGPINQTQPVYLPSAFFCIGLALLISCLNLRTIKWSAATVLLTFYIIVQPINNHPWLVASDIVHGAQQHPERLPVSSYEGAFVFPYFPQLRVYQGYEDAMSPWFRGSAPPSTARNRWRKAQGMVVALNERSNTLKLQSPQGPETFVLDRKNLQIRLWGNPAKLQSLKVGQIAVVGFVENDAQKIARSVEVYRAKARYSGEQKP